MDRSGAGGRTPRILLLDADRLVRDLNGPILESMGYDVVIASDAHGARPLLADASIDVVVADIDVLRRAGSGLREELRRHPAQTISVILTGDRGRISHTDALREGAYDHLAKPWDPDLLRAVVGRAVERVSLARATRQTLVELDDANAQLRDLTEHLQERVDSATAELRRKVAELDTARRMLEAEQRRREHLVHVIAHDLASPLTSVGGYAQLLLSDSVPPERRREVLAAIADQVRRMARLVDDLSSAARLAPSEVEDRPAGSQRDRAA